MFKKKKNHCKLQKNIKTFFFTNNFVENRMVGSLCTIMICVFTRNYRIADSSNYCIWLIIVFFLTQQTVSNWFAKFHTCNLDYTNQARGRPKSSVNNDELKSPLSLILLKVWMNYRWCLDKIIPWGISVPFIDENIDFLNFLLKLYFIVSSTSWWSLVKDPSIINTS